MICTCKASAGLCKACLLAMLDDVRPNERDPSTGWEILKKTIKEIWTRKDDQFKAMNRLCDFLVSANDKSFWFFLGRTPKAPMYPGTGPTVWYHEGKISIQVATYAKFLDAHHMPYVM